MEEVMTKEKLLKAAHIAGALTAWAIACASWGLAYYVWRAGFLLG
jgi:hypothetical protein